MKKVYKILVVFIIFIIIMNIVIKKDVFASDFKVIFLKTDTSKNEIIDISDISLNLGDSYTFIVGNVSPLDMGAMGPFCVYDSEYLDVKEEVHWKAAVLEEYLYCGSKIVKKITITAKKPGTTDINFYIGAKISENKSDWSAYKTVKVNIIDKEKIEEAKKKIEEAQKQQDELENAYKTIPNINASADEIDRFIKSDAAYNNLNNLKTVSKDTAKKWRDKVSEARIDTISRQMYTETVNTLDDYINGGDVDSHKKVLADKIEAAIDATQTTVENYKKQLLIIKMNSSNTERNTNKKFNDVLTDPNVYKPEDILDTDAKEVTDKISIILTVITNIGMILAVLMSAIVGVKYMLGSLEEKAEYKKDMIPYLVGAVLLFGICTIIKVLQSIGNSINNIQ